MDRPETFYITTPIFYPNAKLHMGHAYTTTVSDILARYNRLAGKDAYLLTGSDENTEKLVRAAEAAGKDPKEYLGEIVEGFKDLYAKLGISYDQFIRTTDEERHWRGAQEFWKRLVAAGDIEKRSYEGLYCVGHEAFITEKDLVDGKCPDHNEAPMRLREENYFFKLSKYTGEIKRKIESGELEILPVARKNEILALLERGLEDISFSRPADKMTLGIPVPDDPSQKIYVWGDALTNYVTALGFGTEDDGLFRKFWPADVHVIGKDILRFHAAIWPGMLLSAGLPLPKRLLVHGFITSGGKKMSKSLGNVVDPLELIGEYGAEAVRYFLARHISPFEDGDLTPDGFKEAYNANLANGLGNLVNRVMKMAESNLDAPVEIRDEGMPREYKIAFESFNPQAAAEAVWNLIGQADKTIQELQPFKLVKDHPMQAKEIIAGLVQQVYSIGKLLEPLMPETSAAILASVAANKMPEKPLFMRKD
ncbi:MAG TPA: methionine--tRNA ligase [Candidatus Paceibacterota bacterium]|jgi:methionyl-tRNA synthetase|nr:methionine--tRNA ligase [Candidatus Paceibacterota bacterium]